MAGTLAAFQDYNIFAGIRGSEWVGTEHFKEAFANKEFWLAFKNTIVLNLGSLIIGFPVPVILAILLNEVKSAGIKKATQLILYLPHFLSWVIIAGIVYQLFSGTGMINELLRLAGLEQVNFLGSSTSWRWIYWISGIWQGAGYSMIVYLASLTAIDTSLYEAAYLDGAGRWKRIWYITVQMIRPTITVMLIMQLGKLVSIGFEKPYLMGNVLVKEAADVLSTHVYVVGLQSGRFDYATAIGLFQSAAGIVMVLLANAASKKFGEEGLI